MKQTALAITLLCSSLGLSGFAVADEEKLPLPEEQSSPGALKLNPEGTYKGVAPGQPNLPPKPPKLPVKGPNRMLWPGFQMKEGVATVFLQTSGTPEYSIAEGPKGLVVTIKNTVIPLKNNRRPLKVGYFDSAVTEVDCKTRGRDVEVVIRTRVARAPHTERVGEGAGGYRMLMIDLPTPPDLTELKKQAE